MTTSTNTSGEHASEHHSHAGTYTVIWVILLIATALTVITARADLGGWALVVALCIAFTKALLVLLYFMHLNESGGTIRIVAGVTFLFIGLMLTMQLTDYATRFPPSNPEGSPMGAMPPPPPADQQGFELPNPMVGTTP